MLIIGNGLTDGKTQYSQYAKMACNNSYGPVLSDSECETMEASYPRCAQLIQSCYDNQYPTSRFTANLEMFGLVFLPVCTAMYVILWCLLILECDDRTLCSYRTKVRRL